MPGMSEQSWQHQPVTGGGKGSVTEQGVAVGATGGLARAIANGERAVIVKRLGHQASP